MFERLKTHPWGLLPNNAPKGTLRTYKTREEAMLAAEKMSGGVRLEWKPIEGSDSIQCDQWIIGRLDGKK